MRRLHPLLALLTLGVALLLIGGEEDTPAHRAARREAPSAAAAPRPAAPAVAPVTVEEAPAEVEEGPPEDPAESGPCALLLRLRNAETGEAVAARIQLWRLDAPGNENWTRGDQLHAEVDIGRAGTTVPDLPAGRYRVFCATQREDSEDPPGFDVAGPLSSIALDLALPRTFDAWLRMVDEAGRPITLAVRKDLGRGVSGSWVQPSWRTPRRPRAGDDGDFLYESAMYSSAVDGGDLRPQPATPRGFLIGTFEEDRRDRTSYSTHSFRAEGLTEVLVETERRGGDDRTLLGVCVDREAVLDRIRLPDGRRADEAGARVRVFCKARSLLPGDPPDAWRNLAIQIRVSLRGFERLSAEFLAGDVPPALVLMPTPGGSGAG